LECLLVTLVNKTLMGNLIGFVGHSNDPQKPEWNLSWQIRQGVREMHYYVAVAVLKLKYIDLYVSHHLR